MKLLARIIAFIASLVAITFALSNRTGVTVSLWPFDEVMEAPLGLIMLGGLLVGMLVGASMMWLSMLPHQFLSRRLRREISVLRTQFEHVQKSIAPQRHAYDLSSLPGLKRGWKFWRRAS